VISGLIISYHGIYRLGGLRARPRDLTYWLARCSFAGGRVLHLKKKKDRAKGISAMIWAKRIVLGAAAMDKGHPKEDARGHGNDQHSTSGVFSIEPEGGGRDRKKTEKGGFL